MRVLKICLVVGGEGVADQDGCRHGAQGSGAKSICLMLVSGSFCSL